MAYNFKTSITAAVRRYAKADASFISDVRAIASHAAGCTEKRWQAEFSPVFKAALDNYAPASADVVLSRVKVAFLCEANSATPMGADEKPLQSLRGTYEAGRVALGKIGVLKPAKVRKGANARKGKASKAATPTLLDPAAVKPGTPRTEADYRLAALLLTDTPKLASPLAKLLATDKEAIGDLRKLLRTFIDGRKG
jgi:hypothetical protein